MSDATVIVMAASELAKLALATYFQYARMSGMSPEQIETEYLEQKSRFESNAPSTLPDV